MYNVRNINMLVTASKFVPVKPKIQEESKQMQWTHSEATTMGG
jgi:hypothetical protein